MLTRRQLRVKVMQAVYAHYNGNHQSLKEGGTSVKKSCLDMVNLYITNLALFKALWDFSVEQHKIQSQERKSDNPVNEDYPKIANIAPLTLIAKHPF